MKEFKVYRSTDRDAFYRRMHRFIERQQSFKLTYWGDHHVLSIDCYPDGEIVASTGNTMILCDKVKFSCFNRYGQAYLGLELSYNGKLIASTSVPWKIPLEIHATIG